MSRVLLIASDKSLPLCSFCEVRTKTFVIEGEPHTISFPRGFQVSEHSYYRSCVDEFGYPIKPYSYELDFEAYETDLANLKAYLSEHLTFGDQIQLWSIWISDLPERNPIRSSIPLEKLDCTVLEQLLQADDLCITITI